MNLYYSYMENTQAKCMISLTMYIRTINIFCMIVFITYFQHSMFFLNIIYQLNSHVSG